MSIFRGVNFMPDLKGYTGQRPFRFWCQTVLPLVYDDSLSYYELLNKVVFYINNVISDVSATEENVTALADAFENLQKYMNNYFDNLDVQKEIDEKLDKMAEDGTLDEIIEPLLEDYENETTERIDAMAQRLTQQISQFAGDIATLEARMDTFTNLPEGSTTGDAELADARVGVSGYTYPNVGDAIRGQITDISADIKNLGCTVTNSDLGIVWSNHLLNSNNGELQTASTQNFATTHEMIYIPEGCVLYISGEYAMRIAYYSGSRTFTECDEQNASYYIKVVSDVQHRYVRVMIWHDVSTATSSIGFKLEARKGEIINETSLDNSLDNFNYNTYKSVSGNLPFNLHNTAKAKLKSVPNWQIGTTHICGKNILQLCPDKQAMIQSNVNYTFDTANGTITVTSTGATASVPSANTSFPAEYKTVNGVTWYHNAHFTFPRDTVVTFRSNPDKDITYDFLCQMQIYDGSTTVFDAGDGVTLLCRANTMYAIRFIASAGYSGTTVFKPQAEIGYESTTFEPYKGIEGVAGTSTLSSFNYPVAYILSNTLSNGAWRCYPDSTKKEIQVETEGTFDYITIADRSQGTMINGIETLFLMKFTSATNCIAYIRGTPKTDRNLLIQITDGTTIWRDFGDGIVLNLLAGYEYGYRIVVRGTGHNELYTVHPEIFTGLQAIKEFGTLEGVTNIWNDNFTTGSLEYYERSAQEGANIGAKTYENLVVLTGGKIDAPFERLKQVKMVSFIDDDTTSPTLVQRYHDVMAAHNAVGNYAVMTKRLEDDNTIIDLLREYEAEGFGMLYHCYYQMGDSTRYWESGNEAYDEALIRENFYRGLRYMRALNFAGTDYWVTPYGVNDEFIKSLAKEADMKCLFTISGKVTDNEFVGIGGNVNRWSIPRLGVSANANMSRIQTLVKGLSSGCGWLIIATHANAWGETTTADTVLGDVVDLCHNEGIKIVSVPEAYNTWKCVLEARDMF